MTAPPAAPLQGGLTLLPSGGRPNPYVGPRAFRSGETLFGRGHETEALASLLLAERIVLLHSPSGAGKTSLLQANLIPRLVEEGFDVLHPARVSRVPADPPKTEVCRYTLSAMIDWECDRPDPRPPDELAELDLEGYLATRPRARPDAPEVLIFDQFEELLTLDATDIESKREFCRQAGIVLQNRMRWAIIAMREEFIGALDPFLDLFPTRLAARFRLELLSPESARAAIAGPAERAGVQFAPEAVEQLVSDLRKVRQQVDVKTVTERDGPFVEPVQLQVVCTRLWENLPPDVTVVTAEQVGAVGDVDDALGDYYSAAIQRAAAAGGCEEGDIRRWIETSLIVNRVRAQALQGAEAAHNVSPAAVQALEDAYVVRREERRGGIWYELAHDRLLTPVLKDNARWRDESLSEIEKLAARWVEEGRPHRLLEVTAQPSVMRELNELNRRIKKGTVRVAPEVREFIASSRRFLFRRAAMIYGGAVVLVLSFAVWDLYRGNEDLARANKELEERTQALDDQTKVLLAKSDSLVAKSESLAAKSESLQLVIDSLNRLSTTVYQGLWGLEQTTPDRVQQSVAANQALQTVVRGSEKRSRGAITIEYYFKRRDPERVEFALRDLGYRVTVEQARAEEVATNAISYGSNVPLEDVRIIALAVARTGAQLRRICPFRNTAGRDSVVQVIGSVQAEELPPLSVKQLESIGPGNRLPCPTGPAAAR